MNDALKRPLKSPINTTYYHCLLWPKETVESATRRSRVKVARSGTVYATSLYDTPEGPHIHRRYAVSNPPALAAAIESAFPPGRKVIAWLARGWQDLVLTGLSELMDAGVIPWRWAVLDGARVMVAGKLRERPFAITSLPCWTGGAWNDWEDAVSDTADRLAGTPVDADMTYGERVALSTVATIMIGRRHFRAGAPALSMASQSRIVWRGWMAPCCRDESGLTDAAAHTKSGTRKVVTAPLLDRPDSCRQAERQACYGLPREQYQYGHIDSPVEVWDIRGAYLAALCSFCCPTSYVTRVDNISPRQLHDRLHGHVGLALVQVDSPQNPYPVRLGGRVGRAVGRYWTWLCGAELEDVLNEGQVVSVESAHIWTGSCMDSDAAIDLSGLSDKLRELECPSMAAFWRALYAALVGQWAQWRRDWVDTELPSPFGRWAAWTELDRDSGEIVRYRCLAGRTQRREDSGDARNACPMIYACITAAVRCIVDHFRNMIDPRYVLAQSSDALWIDVRGSGAFRNAVEMAGSKLWTWRCKERYDDVWMDGKGAAVVRIGDEFAPVLTGVPTHAQMGPDGRSRWMVSEPWNMAGTPAKTKGIKLREVSFNAGRLMQENAFPAQPNGPWLQFNTAVMREELLQPCRSRTD